MATTSPTRAEWRPTHMPKLSYRNSASIDPAQLSAQAASITKNPARMESPRSTGSEARGKTSFSTARPGASTTSLRPSMSSANGRSLTNSKSMISPPLKKKSLLGGLFVTKEPTALALERLAAQLEAQHGELSPRAIPGVSSSKIPEHVPKVNTKWDGLPEVLKEREKLQREKARAAKRISQVPSAQSTRSRSADGSRQESTRLGDSRTLQKRSSISTLSSFDSRGRIGHQRHSQRSGSPQARSPSKTSCSDVMNDWTSAKPSSTKSQSLRSPSGSSLPLITSFFPNDIPAPPSIPTRYECHTTSPPTSQKQYANMDGAADSVVEMVPDYTSSPINTPPDRSPLTPPITRSHLSREPSFFPTWNRMDSPIFVSPGSEGLGPPASTSAKHQSRNSHEAFLAGEARPFELPEQMPPATNASLHSPNYNSKASELPALARLQQDLERRPDSSRARLGLRASMLVRSEQLPWESEDFDRGEESERSASPRLSVNGVPKRWSKVLSMTSK